MHSHLQSYTVYQQPSKFPQYLDSKSETRFSEKLSVKLLNEPSTRPNRLHRRAGPRCGSGGGDRACETQRRDQWRNCFVSWAYPFTFPPVGGQDFPSKHGSAQRMTCQRSLCLPAPWPDKRALLPSMRCIIVDLKTDSEKHLTDDVQLNPAMRTANFHLICHCW